MIIRLHSCLSLPLGHELFAFCFITTNPLESKRFSIPFEKKLDRPINCFHRFFTCALYHFTTILVTQHHLILLTQDCTLDAHVYEWYVKYQSEQNKEGRKQVLYFRLVYDRSQHQADRSEAHNNRKK